MILLKELVNILEFAQSGGGDNDKHHKIRDVFVKQILKTVELDKKQMMELKEALEYVDSEEIATIIEIIDAIEEWYDEDPHDVKLSSDWFEVGEYSISNYYYHGIRTMYDHAWTQVYDKKKAEMRAVGTPYKGEPNDLFPYTEQIDHHVEDVRYFAAELYKVFPTFEVAVKKGVENMKLARQKKGNKNVTI